MSIELVMLFDHLMLCHPLLFLLSIFSSIRVFSNELIPHIRWPQYWSFSFSISPSSEYSELISFRMDWFDLLAVHGTLKSLLQHSAFFIGHLVCACGPSCLTLCDPVDCSPPGSSVHGTLQGEYRSCHFLLQGLFPTQGLNPGLLHCRQTTIH